MEDGPDQLDIPDLTQDDLGDFEAYEFSDPIEETMPEILFDHHEQQTADEPKPEGETLSSSLLEKEELVSPEQGEKNPDEKPSIINGEGPDSPTTITTGTYDRLTGKIMVGGSEFIDNPNQPIYEELKTKILNGETGVLGTGEFKTDTGDEYIATYIIDDKGGFRIESTKKEKIEPDPTLNKGSGNQNKKNGEIPIPQEVEQDYITADYDDDPLPVHQPLVIDLTAYLEIPKIETSSTSREIMNEDPAGLPSISFEKTVPINTETIVLVNTISSEPRSGFSGRTLENKIQATTNEVKPLQEKPARSRKNVINFATIRRGIIGVTIKGPEGAQTHEGYAEDKEKPNNEVVNIQNSDNQRITVEVGAKPSLGPIVIFNGKGRNPGNFEPIRVNGEESASLANQKSDTIVRGATSTNRSAAESLNRLREKIEEKDEAPIKISRVLSGEGRNSPSTGQNLERSLEAKDSQNQAKALATVKVAKPTREIVYKIREEKTHEQSFVAMDDGSPKGPPNSPTSKASPPARSTTTPRANNTVAEKPATSIFAEAAPQLIDNSPGDPPAISIVIEKNADVVAVKEKADSSPNLTKPLPPISRTVKPSIISTTREQAKVVEIGKFNDAAAEKPSIALVQAKPQIRQSSIGTKPVAKAYTKPEIKATVRPQKTEETKQTVISPVRVEVQTTQATGITSRMASPTPLTTNSSKKAAQVVINKGGFQEENRLSTITTPTARRASPAHSQEAKNISTTARTTPPTATQNEEEPQAVTISRAAVATAA